jgi:hypothetical protein
MFNDSTPAAHGVEKISAHPLDPERAAHTLAGGEGAFQKLLQFSKDHSDEFWAQVASEFEWIKPWDTVRKGEMPSLEFFSGGIMKSLHQSFGSPRSQRQRRPFGAHLGRRRRSFDFSHVQAVAGRGLPV